MTSMVGQHPHLTNTVGHIGIVKMQVWVTRAIQISVAHRTNGSHANEGLKRCTPRGGPTNRIKTCDMSRPPIIDDRTAKSIVAMPPAAIHHQTGVTMAVTATIVVDRGDTRDATTSCRVEEENEDHHQAQILIAQRTIIAAGVDGG